MKTKTKKEEYHATIKIMGREFRATGKTAIEAITNLKPSMAKGTSVLSVSKGAMFKEKILNAPQTFRLFNASGLVREVNLKNISLIFGGI